MLKTMLPPESEMYQALLRKDSSYEGIFFVGVKTTGIFCRPSCTARKPKAGNVEYFASVGYRACKVCRPLQSVGEYPDWLQPLMREVDANPGIRLRDAELRARGLVSRVNYHVRFRDNYDGRLSEWVNS
jgi:AraC family transcriptional regulator of adaptative response/methylated-DNA-[protein]-cysteine methyltransferase